MSKAKAVHGNVYFFDKKTNETKSKFDKISRDLRYIPRADNPDKSLSKGARALATNYFGMIKKSPDEIIFVCSEFISGITEVGVRQNNRIHEELKDLFSIVFHKSVIVDDKKFHYGFTIQFTGNTEIILKNPKLFYSSNKDKNVRLSRQKCPLHSIYKKKEP